MSNDYNSRSPSSSILSLPFPSIHVFFIYLCFTLASCSEPSGSATKEQIAAIDACKVVDTTLLEPLLGSPIKTMGNFFDNKLSWYSDCHYKGKKLVWVALNSAYKPSKTTDELLESVILHMRDQIDPPRAIEGFSEPAVQYFHKEIDMHFITVQHGSYWIQLGSNEPQLTFEATQLFLKQAP